MSVMLEEDESFSMEGYSEADGYQRIVLQGYLVDRRGDGVYIAPLIPQLFYGYNGAQLQTWRQFIPAGSHVILSRIGGEPSVPREELYWKKISENHPAERIEPMTPVPMAITDNPWVLLGIGAGSVTLFYIVLRSLRPKKRGRSR